MKKMVLVAVVSSLVTASLTAVAFAGASPGRRQAADSTSGQAAVAKRDSGAQLAGVKTVAEVLGLRDTMTRARVRCTSLRCINRQLTKLNNLFNALLNCM